MLRCDDVSDALVMTKTCAQRCSLSFQIETLPLASAAAWHDIGSGMRSCVATMLALEYAPVGLEPPKIQ